MRRPVRRLNFGSQLFRQGRRDVLAPAADFPQRTAQFFGRTGLDINKASLVTGRLDFFDPFAEMVNLVPGADNQQPIPNL